MVLAMARGAGGGSGATRGGREWLGGKSLLEVLLHLTQFSFLRRYFSISRCAVKLFCFVLTQLLLGFFVQHSDKMQYPTVKGFSHNLS